MIGTVRTPPGLRVEVDRELQTLFSRSATVVEAYGSEFARLWDLASRHIRGGKLLRPLLLLETYDALRCSEGPDPLRTEAVRIAAAVEALHYAFLLHDDVIDGDLFRRGRRNLVGELMDVSPVQDWSGGTRHWAQTGGILAGDLLLSCAHQLFARANVPAERRARLLDLLEHTVFETTAGEFADVGLSDGVIGSDLSTVLAMTGRKTATYSFELPLRAAVILAGGSAGLERRLRKAGWHLGVAYQLQDDLLSTFGDADIHGKDAYSDLREGKQTAIICFARMCREWPRIEAELGDRDLSIAAARRIRDRLRECGAEDFVQGLIRDQTTAVTDILTQSGPETIPAEVRGILLTLHAHLDKRQS